MKTAEKILALIIVVGIIMKLLTITGRGIVLVSGLSILAVFYQFLSFAFFNDIAFRDIFKKQAYGDLSVLRIIGTIVLGFCLSIAVLGILFKFQFYTGATGMLLEGILFLFVCLIVALIRYNKSKSPAYEKIFMRIAVVGGFAILLTIIPKMLFLEIIYRNHPAYVQAVKNLNADPNNSELQDEVDRQKEEAFSSSK